MEADRSYVGNPTWYEFYCPGQSNSTTLVWTRGKVNKPMAEVCVEKTIVRMAYNNGVGFELYYNTMKENPVKWSIKDGVYPYEILTTFFTGQLVLFLTNIKGRLQKKYYYGIFPMKQPTVFISDFAQTCALDGHL